MEGALGSGVQGPPREGVHEPTSDPLYARHAAM